MKSKINTEADYSHDDYKDEEVEESVNKPSDYPNDLIHGLLAAHSYEKGLQKDGKVKFHKFSALYKKFNSNQHIDINEYLSGWKIQEIIEDKKIEYLSVIYVNEKEHQLVLAHRGSVVGNIGQSSIQTDIESVLMDRIVAHQAYGYIATSKVVKYAKELDFILSIPLSDDFRSLQ